MLYKILVIIEIIIISKIQQIPILRAFKNIKTSAESRIYKIIGVTPQLKAQILK